MQSPLINMALAFAYIRLIYNSSGTLEGRSDRAYAICSAPRNAEKVE